MSLFHAELAPYSLTTNPLANPNDLIPSNPQYKKVSQSEILAQKIGSVFQNYYALQFDYLYCTSIDMMVYGYMTGMRVGGKGKGGGLEHIVKHVLGKAIDEGYEHEKGAKVHTPLPLPPTPPTPATAAEPTLGFEPHATPNPTPSPSMRMYDDKGFLKGNVTTKHHNPPVKSDTDEDGGDKSIKAGGVLKGGVQYPSNKYEEEDSSESEKGESDLQEEALRMLLRGDSVHLRGSIPDALKPSPPPSVPPTPTPNPNATNSTSFGTDFDQDDDEHDGEGGAVGWGESGARKHKGGAQRRASTLIIAPPMPPPSAIATSATSFLSRVGGAILPKSTTTAAVNNPSSGQGGTSVWSRWRGGAIETHHPQFITPHHTGKHPPPNTRHPTPPPPPAHAPTHPHLSSLPSTPSGSTRDDFNSSQPMSVSLTPQQVYSVYDAYTYIHTHIHLSIIQYTQRTLDLYEKEVDGSGGGGIHQQVTSTSVCILQQQREEAVQKILKGLKKEDAVDEAVSYPLSYLFTHLSPLVTECELLLQLRVSLFIVAIRRIWRLVMDGEADSAGWRGDFEKERGAFWRGQIAVSTRR